MKWIGQQIYDLASRFRNDVFLENISSGTIASGAHLGLDSNNKIVKAVDGGGDLTGITAGVGLSGSSLTGPVPTLTVDFSEFSTVTPTSGDFLATLDSDGANEQKTTTDALATLFSGAGLTASSAVIGVDASQTQITSIGTITTGVWNGTAIANAYLDADTAHLTTAQTFTGSKTIGTNVKLNFRDANSYINSPDANDLEIVATDITLDAATSIALENSTTVTGDFTVNGDNVLFESANADDPIVTIKNTSNAANDMASLNFVKIRDSSGTAATGDNLAEIYFTGEDASGNTQEYARILSEIDVATHGQESGRLKLGVANHDGGNGYGLTMQGGSVNNEVDVTLGLGADSVVTVPGNIDLAGDIDVDGTLETDALTIGGATIAAIGTTAITTLGTIGTGVWNGTAIASANLDADTMHYSAQRQLTHHTIQDDIDTQVVFLSLAEFDGENTTISNNKLPLIAPVAGKLLKVFVRCSHNLSGVDFTWKLYTRTSSVSTNGNAAEIGAQTGTGPTNGNMVTYDFTTGLDSGTNAVGAGDKVQISLETNGSTSNANFFITLMWEWDLS